MSASAPTGTRRTDAYLEKVLGVVSLQMSAIVVALIAILVTFPSREANERGMPEVMPALVAVHASN
jgi:hypothetical protein